MSKKRRSAAEAARDESTASKYNPRPRNWWVDFCKKHPEDAEQIREVIKDFRAGKSALVSVQSASRFIREFFPTVTVSIDCISRIPEWRK